VRTAVSWISELKIPDQLNEDDKSPAHYDAIAESWDSFYEEPSRRGHSLRSRSKVALELIGEGPGALLEVGAGTGRLLAALSTRGWTVSGIDPAPRMLELVRVRVPSASDRLILASVEALPFEDESFDVLAAIGVLEYVQTMPALREITRVLRPGGKAVISLRNGRAPTAAWRHAVVYPVVRRIKRIAPFGRPLGPLGRRPWSPRQVRRAIDRAGLVVERVETAACWVLPDPLDHLAPGFALRAAERAERSASLRRALGTQRLLVATKV
jgi:ubiquinone/menaquinone biosynthesis C-methylase UbiE